jgi:uncharacterized protein YndB with AHSA1/START domain
MKLNTHLQAGEGRQDLLITREFDLPVALLFKAHSDPELFGQWMGTKVLKHEMRPHGSYRFETCDPKGQVLFCANGTIHEFVPGQKITRTFEMENSPFPVQLEFLEFESLTENRSKLSMHIVYRSAEYRDQHLQMPFAQGLNMAHNRLQDLIRSLN